MPPRLLIIADDLTGANDTGVQFAKHGMTVIVHIHHQTPMFIDDCEVLVVNTESRHLSADEAFRRVYDVAAQGRQCGISQFYKKTDSTLRGNIGSELAALLAATNESELFFAPAYPKLHRITRNGAQVVNGAPLHHSSFAQDALNPIRDSSIAQIIAQQTVIPTISISARQLSDTERERSETPAIYVVDAETDEQLQSIAHSLNNRKLLAGSAGLAESMAAAMHLPTAPIVLPNLPTLKLVVNGSLHEVSLRQVAHAAQNGWQVIEVSLEPCVAPIIAALKNGRRVVLTTSPQCMRNDFAPYMATIVAQILDQVVVPTMAVFGGDTLAAIAAARGWTAFRPCTEFLPGVPLVQVCGQGEILLLTKAGGFGESTLLAQIQQITEM